MPALLALAACSGPSTPGSSASQATMLTVAYKQGGSYRYHYRLTLDGTTSMGQGAAQPVKVDSSADVGWRVTSVDAGGDATIDVSLSSLKTTVTGSMLPGSSTTTTTTTSDTQRSTFTLKPSGEIVSGAGLPGPAPVLSAVPGMSPPGADQFLAVLPDHTVKPGDTWTRSVTVPGPAGQAGTSFTTDNRFLRYDNLKTGRAAVVETRASTPVDITIDLQQLMQAAGAAASPPPMAAAFPPGARARSQGTASFDSTTWFDTRTHVVEKLTSVQSSDLTTSYAGAGPPPPSGVTAPAMLTPMHFQGRQTLQLDLLA